MGIATKTSRLETHPVCVNAIMLECHFDNIVDVAKKARSRILDMGVNRPRDRKILWLAEMDDEEVPPRSDFYKPSTYILSGTFDIAAIFLSSSFELTPWMLTDELRVAGQDMNLALLPTAGSLGLAEAEDFNRVFINRYKALSIDASADSLSDVGMSTVAITKIKLNPSSLWPNAESRTDEGNLRPILRALWKKIENWISLTRVSPDESPPAVCLGIALGWNEILVIAHSDSPGKLMKLSLCLRQAYATIDQPDTQEISHICGTTITSIGHEYALKRRAEKAYQALGNRTQRKKITAREILQLSAKIAGDATPSQKGDVQRTFFQLSCCTYPGHEYHLTELLQELELELKRKEILQAGADDITPFSECGKRDLWSPRIEVCDLLPPRAAAALVFLLQAWIRNGGFSLIKGKPNTPDAFDFYTRFACPGNFDAAIEKLPEQHTKRLPVDFLIRDNVSRALELKNIKAKPKLLRELRLAMAYLQVPYYLSEQILNFINTFYWANSQEMLWDDITELVPVVLAFVSNICGHRRWWNGSECEVPTIPWEGGSLFSSSYEEAKINQSLNSYLAYDLPRFISAFRASFYNRYFTNYMTVEMPDVNLRYRGAIHQLLTLTNMILSSLVGVTVGPRACMVLIADKPSPEVSAPCDITVVTLNSRTFATPILLESLGHEVGHQLIREILRDTEDAKWRRHTWVDLKHLGNDRNKIMTKIQDCMRDLNRNVFGGSLIAEEENGTREFIESTSDFIEYKLLGYENVHEWASSFLLRALLVNRSNTRPLETGSRCFPPQIDDLIMLSAIIRIALVAIADFLTSYDGRPLSPLQVPAAIKTVLENLRRHLYENAPLGLSGDVAESVSSSSQWHEFISDHIFPLPCFQTTEGIRNTTAIYILLEKFLDQPGKTGDGTGRFWPRISHAFKRLRTSTLANLLPGLYVQHWMNENSRENARNHTLRQDMVAPDLVPWTSAFLPLSEHKKVQTARASSKRYQIEDIQTVIFQRGTMLPRSTHGLEQSTDATREFLSDLLLIIPAWRTELIRVTDAITDTRDEFFV